MLKKQNKKLFVNPHYALAWLIGWLFWPLTKVSRIRNNYLPILRLINEVFVNNPVAGFLALWYPTIFIGILPNIAHPQFIIFGVLSLIPINIGLLVMPMIIVNLKNSSILKRIGATDTNASDFTIVLVFYFSLVAMVTTLINLGLGTAFYGSSLLFDAVNWGEFFLSAIIGTIIAISIGIFVSGVFKTEYAVMGFGLAVTLPGAFLSGQFFPHELINTQMGPVRYIAYLFPQKIATHMTMVAATSGMAGGAAGDFNQSHSIFDMSEMRIPRLTWIKQTNDIMGTYREEQLKIINDLVKDGLLDESRIAEFNKLVDVDLMYKSDVLIDFQVKLTALVDSINAEAITNGALVEATNQFKLFDTLHKGNVDLIKTATAEFDLITKTESIINWTLFPVWTTVFTGLGVKYFSWGTR